MAGVTCRVSVSVSVLVLSLFIPSSKLCERCSSLEGRGKEGQEHHGVQQQRLRAVGGQWTRHGQGRVRSSPVCLQQLRTIHLTSGTLL